MLKSATRACIESSLAAHRRPAAGGRFQVGWLTRPWPSPALMRRPPANSHVAGLLEGGGGEGDLASDRNLATMHNVLDFYSNCSKLLRDVTKMEKEKYFFF